MKEYFSQIQTIINALSSGRKLILTHSNADPDGIGSAIALKLSFPDITIGAAEGVQPLSRRLCQKLGISVQIDPEIKGYDSIFVIDTSSRGQLEDLWGPISNFHPLYVIDHHAPGELKGDVCLNSERPSCVEIIYDILKVSGKPVTKEMGLALLCGIITDTGRFRYATAETHQIFAEILEKSGLAYDDVFSLIDEGEDDVSMRIAHLKCGQRAEFEQIGNLIIARSKVGAFEGSASHILILSGADIAFVGSQEKDEFRISGRASWRAMNVGVHLGKMMQEIGKRMNFSGGGHAGAAGLNGKGNVDEVLKICLDYVKSQIKSP